MKGVDFTKNSRHKVRYPDVIPNVTRLGKGKPISMFQVEFVKGNFMFIQPTGSSDYYEFCYIVEGKIGVGDKVYDKFDYFEITDSQENCVVKILEDTVILSSTPKVFEEFNNNHLGESVLRMEGIQDKDHYTFEHCKRVKGIAYKIAKKMGISSQSLVDLIRASFFHDVGKISVDDLILQKPGRYTEDEYLIMKEHVNHSNTLLEGILNPHVLHIISMHHERLDGSGYPLGIKDIPLEGRIIAVADTFDAMTTNRVYKKGKTFEEAIEELLHLTHQYDEEVIKVLKELIESGEIAFESKID